MKKQNEYYAIVISNFKIHSHSAKRIKFQQDLKPNYA